MAIVDEARAGRCWECGYELRGLPTPRCPECGRAFDPNDATTMNMGTEVGPVRRWLMRPPGWPLHVVTGLAVIISLWAAASPTRRGALVDELSWPLVSRYGGFVQHFVETASDLGDPRGRFLIGAAIWLIVGMTWIGRRAARGIVVKGLSRHSAATFAYWRRWLATPLIFGMTVVLCRTSLPVTAGFWMSKSALDRAARDARAIAPNGLPPRWIGIYPPRRRGFSATVDTKLDEFEMYFGFGGMFVHSDSPIDPNAAGNRWRWSRTPRVRHLSGGWYEVQIFPLDD